MSHILQNGIVGSSRVKIIEDNEQTGELVATKDYLRKYKVITPSNRNF